MEEIIKDQVKEEVTTDQSSEKQSVDTNEETHQVTLEEVYELTKGLQKGYTLTRQELSEIKAIKESGKALPESTDDEYLTVGKLRQMLAEDRLNQQQAQQAQAQAFDSQVQQLEVEGVLKTEEDKENLYKYASRLVKEGIIPGDQETVLIRASKIWQEKDSAKREALKEMAKTKAKQEEGSKIGTSQKSSDGEQGVSYEKIKRMDFFGGF